MKEASAVTKGTYNTISITAEPFAVVIPAYNEATRIGNVLQAAIRVPDVAQIIVVDDGSHDNTVANVRQWQRLDNRIHLITLQQNHGKATAITTGANHSSCDIVTFLDADLIGLLPQHIQQLADPVRRRRSAMTLGVFHKGRRSTDVTHRYLPFLSGQRCLRWSLFADTFRLRTAGWGLETALNFHAWYQQYPVQKVLWAGVTHAMRPEKQPGVSGYTSHIAMWWHIGRYVLDFSHQVGLRPMLTRLQNPQSATPAGPRSIQNSAAPRPTHKTHPLLNRRPLL